VTVEADWLRTTLFQTAMKRTTSYHICTSKARQTPHTPIPIRPDQPYSRKQTKTIKNMPLSWVSKTKSEPYCTCSN